MGLNYVIEPLDSNDQGFLENILYHMVYSGDGEPVDQSIIYAPKVNQYIANWEIYPGYGFIAVHPETDEKMGAAWIRYFDESHPGYGFIENGTPELCIAVFPQFRGQGLGTALIQAIIETVQSKKISLSVHVNNPAIKLYERLGFSVERIEAESMIMSRFCSELQSQNPTDHHLVHKHKRKWGVVLCIFLLIATFGLGPIDLGLYKANINKSESSGCASSLDPHQSYHIQCVYSGEIVAKHTIVTVGKDNPILIKAYIEPCQFEGNYYLPFYKKFKMTYKSEFGNVNFADEESEKVSKVSDVQVVHFPKPWAVEGKRIMGDTEGTMEVEIIGICSITKAKRIAMESAIESIKNQIATHAK